MKPLLLLLGVALLSAAQSKAGVRRGIEMTQVGSPFDLPEDWPAISSPDGRREALITYTGDVTLDRIRYKLLLFDHHGNSIAAPRAVLDILSEERGNTPGISKLTWSRDSKYIFALLADRKTGLPQLTRIDTATGANVAMTTSQTGLTDFALDRAGAVIAYLEFPAVSATSSLSATYSGSVISTESPYDLISGAEEAPGRSSMWRPARVRMRANGRDATIVLRPGEFPMSAMGLSVSPSGRYVIVPVCLFRTHAPQRWQDRAGGNAQVFYYGLRIYDRVSGTLRWLVDRSMFPKAVAWGDDERSVFVTGVLDTDGVHKDFSQQAAVVDVASGREMTTFSGALSVVRNGDLSSIRILKDGRRGMMQALRRSGKTWRLVPEPRERTALRLVRDANHPPVLAEHDFAAGTDRTILDLNPEIQASALNPVKTYEWMTGLGMKLQCGLYFPRGYKPGARYPLVVQTHGWDKNEFWYDGPSTAGFAAQALADEGFLVAQIGDVPHSLSTPNEGPAGADMIDSLIDALNEDGLVDPSRLGITAWSRSGFVVRYTLVFGRHHFGAAVLVDSQNGGFLEYVLANGAGQDDEEHQMGAAPYGSGLDAWRDRSPMFNIDRISTPIELVQLGPHILNHWEDWKSLQRLNKPVELTWLSGANHWPIRPSERMQVQQGAVDWFNFWLLGKVDPVTEKAEQYRRWRKLGGPVIH